MGSPLAWTRCLLRLEEFDRLFRLQKLRSGQEQKFYRIYGVQESGFRSIPQFSSVQELYIRAETGDTFIRDCITQFRNVSEPLFRNCFQVIRDCITQFRDICEPLFRNSLQVVRNSIQEFRHIGRTLFRNGFQKHRKQGRLSILIQEAGSQLQL